MVRLTDMDVDQMVDDIFDQEENKNTKNLKQISKYKSNEYLGDDDFDIIYRTPKHLIENETIKQKDLIGTGIIPQNFTVVDNIKQYAKDYYNFNVPNNTGGFYDIDNNDVIVKSLPSENRADFDIALIHEGIHQKHRLIEKNIPIKRVKTEPSQEYFNIMKKSSQPKLDFINSIMDENRGFDNELKKNRAINDINKLPFHEQLAYYGSNYVNHIISNPKNKTQKMINRMWFE